MAAATALVNWVHSPKVFAFGNDPVNHVDPDGTWPFGRWNWGDLGDAVDFVTDVGDVSALHGDKILCDKIKAQISDEIICGEESDAVALQKRYDEWCPGVYERFYEAVNDIENPWDFTSLLNKKSPKPPMPKHPTPQPNPRPIP